MSLTRKMLSAMGIEPDKIDEIIDAHTATVNGLKEEIDKYKADATRLPTVEKELEETRAAISNGDKSPYKVKYEAIVEERDNLQKEFDEFKTNVAAKETLSKKQAAYRQLLKDVGVSEKRIDAIMRVSNFDTLELDKDNSKLKDSDTLKDNIKSEWSDFIGTTGTQGAHVATPPANVGGSKRTKEEILAIKNTAERQQAMLENKELFI